MKKCAAVLCVVAMAALSVGAADGKDCPRPVAAGAAKLASAKNVAIDAAITRTRLAIAGGAPGSKTELVLRDIRFDTHPGTQFHVILERHGNPEKRARVGTLSFYLPTNTPGAIGRTFDVTDELRQIAVPTAELQHVVVVFEATTGRGGGNAKARFDPESKLTVGEIELRVKTEK